MGEKFNRTLALCPECGDYGIATRYDLHHNFNGYKKNVSRALKAKWCIKCKAIIILDKTIRVFYQEKDTSREAFLKSNNFTKRRDSRWLTDLKPL